MILLVMASVFAEFLSEKLFRCGHFGHTQLIRYVLMKSFMGFFLAERAFKVPAQALQKRRLETSLWY